MHYEKRLEAYKLTRDTYVKHAHTERASAYEELVPEPLPDLRTWTLYGTSVLRTPRF